MKFWSIKINTGEKMDPKSVHPKLHDVYKQWLVLLSVFIGGTILGIIISVTLFWSLFAEYKPESKDGENEQALDINIELMQKVVGKREELKNRELKIPRDPSL